MKVVRVAYECDIDHAIRRYRNDARFRHLVSSLETLMRDSTFTSQEIRDAVGLAEWAAFESRICCSPASSSDSGLTPGPRMSFEPPSARSTGGD